MATGGGGSRAKKPRRRVQGPREREGANYAQIICKEVKKAFRKQSHKRKKRRVNDSESDSDSD